MWRWRGKPLGRWSGWRAVERERRRRRRRREGSREGESGAVNDT